MTSFDLVLTRTNYPTLYPRVAPLVPARPPLLPVLPETNQVRLANALVNSKLRRPSERVRASTCPPITGATLQQINLGSPPASWLEGAGGVATTWGLVSLAGLAVAATGGAAIPATALLKAGGAIAVGAAASLGASALRQAALESASRRVSLTGAEQIEIVPLADSMCVYTFPRVDPSPGAAVGSGAILFAASIQEASRTVRAVALLPESVEPDNSEVLACWGSLEVPLMPGQLVPELSSRQWSGIGELPTGFDPPSLLVELKINGKFSGACTLGQLAEPPENGQAGSLELIGNRHQLVWSPRPIGRFRKTLTLPAIGQQPTPPQKPPALTDGNWRLSAIWRQPGLSFRSELFASEQSVRNLRAYLESWPIRPTEIQLTETSRPSTPDTANLIFEPVRGRYWDGERWLRYYWRP